MSVLNFVGHVPLWVSWVQCHRAIVPSWVQNFSWVFRESKIFSRWHFVSPKLFLVGISWVQSFSRGYFVGSKFFSRVFVGPKSFLMSTVVDPKFSRGYFVSPKFFSREYFVCPIFFPVVDFVIQRFSVAGCISESDRNRNTKIHLKPRILFQKSELEECFIY